MITENLKMCTTLPKKISNNGERAINEPGKRWQNGQTLRVQFLNGTQDVQTRVQGFINQWSLYANIIFKYVSEGPAEIRVGFKWVTAEFPDGDAGSHSLIGTDALSAPQNSPTVNLGWVDSTTTDLEMQRVVCHEFGHVLSLDHEQFNPKGGIKWNRPAVYAYFEQNQHWTQEQVDINIFGATLENRTNYTQFDPDSIMLYHIPPQLTLDGYSTKENYTISETDKAFIQGQYPFAGNR